jgi:malate dehydrogenase (quinone)
MRDTRTLLDFFDEEYEFDEAAFRAETIDNFPRVDDATDDPVDAGADAADASAADD